MFYFTCERKSSHRSGRRINHTLSLLLLLLLFKPLAMNLNLKKNLEPVSIGSLKLVYKKFLYIFQLYRSILRNVLIIDQLFLPALTIAITW